MIKRSQISRLSLRGRIALVIVCLEAYCRRHAISDHLVDEAIELLWQLPERDEWDDQLEGKVESLRDLLLYIRGEDKAPPRQNTDFSMKSEFLEDGSCTAKDASELILLAIDCVSVVIDPAVDLDETLEHVVNALQILDRHDISHPDFNCFRGSSWNERFGAGHARPRDFYNQAQPSLISRLKRSIMGTESSE